MMRDRNVWPGLLIYVMEEERTLRCLSVTTAQLCGQALKKSIPLWVLFVAVQLLDVFWSIFVLLGIEKFESFLESRERTHLIFTTCRTRTVWTEHWFGPLLPALCIGCSVGQMDGVVLRWFRPLSSPIGSLIWLFTVLISLCMTTA